MPPAISDDEGGSPEIVVPIVSKEKRASKPISYADEEVQDDYDEVEPEKAPAKTTATNDEEDGEEGDDGDDDDEDLGDGEFIVEKILAHKVDEDGTVTYKVKWEGYEKKSDQTWEPEDNLKENASEVLDEYLLALGGREMIFEDSKKAKAGKKRGRQPSGAPGAAKRSRTNGKHPGSTSPPASAKAVTWSPPSGSWEDEIESVDACEDETTGKLIIFLNWKNGHKTRHGTEVVYKRCPQKMLQFYERHIRIIKTQPE